MNECGVTNLRVTYLYVSTASPALTTIKPSLKNRTPSLFNIKELSLGCFLPLEGPCITAKFQYIETIEMM